MKYLILCFLFIIGAEVSAQETGKLNFYSSALQQGEMLNFGTRSIRFKNVISDSRCPKDVTCFWEGEAVVLVEVYQDGSCIEEKIIVIGSPAVALEFKETNIMYTIEQLVLSPYPSVKSGDLKDEYTLHVKLRETEGS